MPRRKVVQPQHLTDDERRNLSWNQNISLNSEALATVASVPPRIVLSEQNCTTHVQLDDDVTKSKVIRKTVKKKSVIPVELSSRLARTRFYITVLTSKRPENCGKKNDAIVVCLGKYRICVCNGDSDDVGYLTSLLKDSLKQRNDLKEFWLYVSQQDVGSFLYFELANELVRWYDCSVELPFAVLSALQCKALVSSVLTLVTSSDTSLILEVSIGLTSSAFSELSFASELPSRIVAQRCIKTLLAHFGGVGSCELMSTRQTNYAPKEDISYFYRALKDRHESLQFREKLHIGVDVQHPFLIPKLRRYQCEAVAWMLSRENISNDVPQKSPNPLYQPFLFVDGTSAYYNSFGGVLTKQMPMCQLHCYGGVLADEMGLGKTVEVLACILLHPFRKVEEAATDKRSRANVANIARATSIVSSDELEISELLEELVYSVASQVESNHTFAKRKLLSPKRPVPQSRVTDTRGSKKARTDCSHNRDNSSQLLRLECLCGITEFDAGAHSMMQCVACGSWQHATCVNWQSTFVDDYLCPHCCYAAEPIESKTTLIISPASICHQWYEEVQKHVRSNALDVYVYQGVAREGFVQPHALAKYDIVITTYETLRQELSHCDLPPNSRFRRPKRFTNPPTPMTALRWWRVCLDEAQMVECVTTKAAEMCCRLRAVNRWCITGTPVQKSVNDLYGLYVFLQLEPYWVREWWERALFLPYLHGTQCTSLINAIAPVLWRTSKRDVLDQMGIPTQTEEIEWLEFSPIEEHFYRRTHEDCARVANQILAKFPDRSAKLSELARQSLDAILRPLLKLRQACISPQIAGRGRGGHFLLPNTTKKLTMEEVLEQMIKKSKVECEEEHRRLLLAHFGLAGLSILHEKFADAAEYYREVLRSIAEYSEDVLRTDPMQKLHALHNLAELIREHGAEIPPTLRDSSLAAEGDAVKERYLAKSIANVEEALKAFKKGMDEVKEWLHSFKRGEGWWLETCDIARHSNLDAELTDRVRSALLQGRSDFGVDIAGQFRDVTGMRYLFLTHVERLVSSRKALVKGLENLAAKGLTDNEFNASVVDCHLRPATGFPSNTCAVCVIDMQFDDYEGKLYNFKEEATSTTTMTNENEEEVRLFGKLRRGTWVDSPLEKALKAIHSFAKNNKDAMKAVLTDSRVDELLEYGRRHLRLFDEWKREFRLQRRLWMSIRDHIALWDEARMATVRLRWRTALDPAPGSDGDNESLVDPPDVVAKMRQFEANLAVARSQLATKLNQAEYLKRLRTTQASQDGSADDCPVCRNRLGVKWAVLTCGHCYCCECMRQLIRKSVNAIRCPLCRAHTPHLNVSFVVTRAHRDALQGETRIVVKGSWSTKVEAAVRCLLRIQRAEPMAKSLVFSTWPEVLDLLATALEENRVPFEPLYRATATQNFQASLSRFKATPEVRVLLIPVHSGANGLNIVEATHVLLMEPLISPYQEQQAIGRVHRIGQHSKTTVHRFLVHGTIEERMHEMVVAFGLHANAYSDMYLNEDVPFTLEDLSALFAET